MHHQLPFYVSFSREQCQVENFENRVLFFCLHSWALSMGRVGDNPGCWVRGQGSGKRKAEVDPGQSTGSYHDDQGTTGSTMCSTNLDSSTKPVSWLDNSTNPDSWMVTHPYCIHIFTSRNQPSTRVPHRARASPCSRQPPAPIRHTSDVTAILAPQHPSCGSSEWRSPDHVHHCFLNGTDFQTWGLAPGRGSRGPLLGPTDSCLLAHGPLIAVSTASQPHVAV